jgi:hypothetical protein
MCCSHTYVCQIRHVGVDVLPRICPQVIERLDTVRVNRQGVPIEVALTQDMHHLGVARCLAWGIGKPDPELAQLSPAAATPTCWMVQELCNKHTLVVSTRQQHSTA